MSLLEKNLFTFVLILNILRNIEYSTIHACPYSEDQSISPRISTESKKSCQPPKPRCDFKSVYYTLDGSCNNIDNPSWGQAKTRYNRFMPANYADGACGVNMSSLKFARKIRTTLLTDREIPSNQYNILYYGFGQWLDHDADNPKTASFTESCCTTEKLTPAQINGCLPLIIPENDAFYSKFNVTCIDKKRVQNTHQWNCNLDAPCVPINFQTSLLDLSMLYGLDINTSKQLRSFHNGFLKSANNSMTNFQMFPLITEGVQNCPNGGIDNEVGGYCWKAGDRRVNLNPEITTVIVLLHRMHNLIALNLTQHWNSSDEEIFQESRRLLIASFQHIAFSEYVPLAIGYEMAEKYDLLPLKEGHAAYNPNVNPQTLAEYAFAVGRAPHSMIKGTVTYKNSDGTSISYALRDKYFNQRFILNKNVFQNLVECYANTDSNAQDEYGSEEISNYVEFNKKKKYGNDLAAIDILRGLDAGLPSYNDVRGQLELRKFRKFKDLKKEISNKKDIEKLKTLYSSVDDIPLYVGGLLEKPLNGSSVGPTFSTILAEAFSRWKFGDRLYYEFPGAGFSKEQLQELRKMTFAHILCWVTNVDLEYKFPKNAFLIPSKENPLMSCRKILENGPNFKMWYNLM